MIITLIILATIGIIGHKFVMNAVENYSYDNTLERYQERYNTMYWDVIKDRNRN